MSLLDLFLADPSDPVERAQAIADIAELRARRGPCDCDRCCTSCPHETWCPALADDDECPGCDGTGDCTECAGNGCMDCNETGDCPECDGFGEVEDDEAPGEPRECRTCGEPADADGRITHRPGTPCVTDYRAI